ncbi:phage portal protein, partial [Enterococcus lactis]|uniref:phage portal protein n=1 Tax=Enterococcus lactis TaxID=357441 RepID=UPI0022E18423
MAFFKARQNTTGDPFLDHVVSIQSDDYTTSFTSVRALRNSDVFAAVRIIASDIASSPIQLVKNNMPQADDELVKLLNEKPNSEMDGWHFKFALAVNMLLNGHLLPNSSVTVTQLDNGTLSYQIGDKKRRVKSSDILHFKYFTQDGLTGLPPLYALRDELKI